jgi:hypothetical protein
VQRPTILILAVIGMALMLSSGVALAASLLDVQYSDVSKQNSYEVIASDSAAAQLFYPRATGKMDKVSVYVGQNGTNTPTGDVIASIRPVSTLTDPETGWEYREISDTKLGEGSVPADGHVPPDGSFGWVDIPLSQPASVQASQSLALVLETTTDSSSGYRWGAAVEPIYCGASACDHSTQIRKNGTWSYASVYSFFFRTYVDDGSTTTPPPRDTTPPETTIDSSSPSPSGIVTINDSASFAFSSSESGSTFQCRLVKEKDGTSSDSGWNACNSPKSYTGLSDGSYTFYVKAVDPAGNSDATSASHKWTVDKTAPTGTVSINNGDLRTRSQSVKLTLSATDPSPGSGVAKMRISNTLSGLSAAPWEAYSTSKDWILTKGTGTKAVYVEYRDGVGNTSERVTDTITYKP